MVDPRDAESGEDESDDEVDRGLIPLQAQKRLAGW